MPLSEIASGEPGALLVIEMEPVALPAAVGANLTLKVEFEPAVSVSGVVRPDMLKPAPEALAAEIVTLAVPVFVTVTGTVEVAPVSRLPKLTLAGFADSAPWTPVPVKATVGSESLLTTEIVPEALPAVDGSKTAENVVLWPAPRVTGTVMPLTLKPVPVALTCVIVVLVLPLLLIVTVWVALLPTASLPKAMLPGFTVSV